MSAGWSLRPVTPEDFPALAALWSCSRPGVTAEGIQATDARRDPTHTLRRRLLVDAAGEAVGASQLQTFAFAPPGFLQAQVVVEPRLRQQGAGRQLWADVVQAGREAQASGLTLDVADDDPGSLAWGTRRGAVTRVHRFASELDLTTFDAAPFQSRLDQAAAQGVTFKDLGGAGEEEVERFVNFVADRLTETPDLRGHPRWPLAEVRRLLRLNAVARPDWWVLAVGPQGEWLGTSILEGFHRQNFGYNSLTATAPEARGRGLALPLKLQVIARAQAAGFPMLRTNNHSGNAPMLAVNQRLGYQSRTGRFEVHFTL
ncbi:GNAT family N-acetyltransferase [Deinococcus arcticus]|uniref:GNAT family N-acetyltransferase n=1 Tax=Deinococcus arcticus TaxID=2136176 RepID=A0A2T3W6X8_9DEIO|nr:GNAT family N-acetyltransferase [Deinococcus arcticus]PTA67503.1 GNAT family N-acetyltransferase [Deinococcus arcticus]